MEAVLIWSGGCFSGLLFAVLLRLLLRLRRFRLEQPSNERNWVNDNARTPKASIEGDHVTLHDVRDFHWRSTREYDERWTDVSFNLNDVKRIWLVLEAFEPKHPQMAHTLLSFELSDGRRLACSIEVRREQGERFHPIAGLGRTFELIYVWGTEADLIGVRTRCRPRSVTRLFESVVLVEGNERRMMESYLRRTNQLAIKPEWYNTIWNTCTTNLVDHVNEVYPGRVPMGLSVLLPGLSPKMLAEENLIVLNGDLAATMDSSIIDERGMAWDGAGDFGDWIRGINDDE